MKKIRLDVVLVDRGMVESRTKAQKMIMAGAVIVDGMKAAHASDLVSPGSDIALAAQPRFVSRGGEKLDAALSAFGLLDLNGQICADIGASTGGFTDCLLQHGAERVYAIDVGHGELHWKLRNDSRVIVMEKVNARFVRALPETIDLIVIDASFISIKTIIPIASRWLGKPCLGIIALIKPQFEAGRIEAGRSKGVIRDPLIHQRVLREVLSFVALNGFNVYGLIQSPLLGPKGNVEFLARLGLDGPGITDFDDLILSVTAPSVNRTLEAEK